MTWGIAQGPGAKSADVFRGGRVDAERLMKAAGTKPPRACRCEEEGDEPHEYYDHDLEQLRCHRCAREVLVS